MVPTSSHIPTLLPAQRAPDRLRAFRALTAAKQFIGCFSLHDAIMLGHFAMMWTLLATSGAAETWCAQRVLLCGATLMAGCVLARGAARLPGWVRSAPYRVLIVAMVLGSYLMLRGALPLLQEASADGALNAIDVAVFGVEPTRWLEPHTTPRVVEYFAFFYFSYFVLCAGFSLVALGPTASSETSSEFALGTSVVYGVGQLGYVLVPGVGPTHYLANVYASPLEGGFFWRCVLATVEAGSALGDVFPSLHTAAPVWFALFALRRARRTRALAWRVTAAVTAAFAVNIVLSTIVLRWHYAVDVVAGLLLAALAACAAPRLTRLERAFRSRHGLSSAWDFDSTTEKLANRRPRTRRCGA